MKKTIEASIRLRRDNDFNFEKIKDTFIPLNGEVVLVDTATTGLRAKVGDGISTYAQLPFTDADLRNAALQGYYSDENFYQDNTLATPFPKMVNKVYIDKTTCNIYYFNGENYEKLTNNYPTASANTPGVVKLYSTTGQNTDGTMTQKAITDELDLRYKAEIDGENELLIFSL